MLGLSSLLFCVVSLPAFADDPRLSFAEAEPLPKMNARFERTEGWIGADAAYSVVLSAQRRLWLFDDTWVGSVRDGKRADATMVNNSVALQDGNGDAEKLRFVIRSTPDKKVAALFSPADGPGWFWPQAGAYADKKLYLWLSQIEKTADPGVFGFRQIGQTLAIVENPNDDPTTWRWRSTSCLSRFSALTENSPSVRPSFRTATTSTCSERMRNSSRFVEIDT